MSKTNSGASAVLQKMKARGYTPQSSDEQHHELQLSPSAVEGARSVLERMKERGYTPQRNENRSAISAPTAAVSNSKKTTTASTSPTVKEQLTDMNKNGNVDLLNRPVISAKKLEQAGWGKQGDGTATVYSSSYSNEDGTKTVLVTPILQNGRVLTPDELGKAANDILNSGVDNNKILMGTFTGKNSIAEAGAYSQKVHELHEVYYGDKNKGTAAAKLPQIGSNSFENIPTYKEQKKAYKDNTAAEFKGKYGVDMSEFKQSDYYKWATEHGFVFMHADQAGLSESPRMGTKHSEEDIAEEKRLRYLLQYNNRREELEQDKNGTVKAAASGARNSIAFNTFKRLENWADKNDSMKQHGKYVNALSEEYKANLADIDTQYEQNHPTAKAVGEGAADLAKLAALQGAVGKIIDGVGWLASKPQWVIRAVKDGLTFGIKNGLDSAGRGDDAKTVARNTGIGTVGGAAGGTAAHFTGAALENVLFRYGLQNKVIPEIIRNGAAAANFSLADTASTYFLHPENERPSAQEIAKDAGVAFAFASIITAVHTSEIKANSKQTLDNLDKSMTASYEEMLRAAVEKDGVNTKKFAQNVIDYTEAMERYLDGKGVEILDDNAASSTVGEYLVEQGKIEPKTNETVLEKARFVGEDSRVRSIKSDLQEIRNRAQDYLTKADAIIVDGKVTDTPLEIEGGGTTNTEPIRTEQVTTPKAEPLQTVNHEISPQAQKITAELSNEYNVSLVGTGNKIDEAYQAIHDNPHSDKNAMTAWEISSEIGRGIAQGIKADNVEETGNNIAARIFEKLFEDMSVDTDGTTQAANNEPAAVQTSDNGGFIDDREYTEVGKRNINAFQYDNPEVKPFYKAAANELLSDISSTIKGQKVYISSSNMANGTPDRVTGQKRLTSESIAKIKDVTGASYDQIKDALTRLINDHGQENIALAKRIELVIDDMLTDGYTDFNGNEIPPNEEYIAVKNNLSAQSTQTAETQPGMTDYRAGLVTENITKGMNTKTGAPSRADNMQSVNSRIQSDSNALFDRDFIRAYVKDFLIGMAQRNSSAFNALKQMDGYVGEELIKEVINGNAAPEYKNNNYFRSTVEELKKVLADAAEKNVIMHNRAYGESEQLNKQLEAIRNGDFSAVDMNEYGFAEVPDGQKAPGLIQDKYSSRLTGEEITALDSIGKTIGVPIKVISSIKLNNANGCYHNGVVYVSLEAQDKPMVVFSHEVTHYLENTPGYEAYKDAVMDVMARSDGKYETELINEKIRAYAESGIQLTREDAVHEIVADYTRNILNSPEDAMEYVNGIENENQKRTVIQAFCDAIKKLLAKIKGIFKKPPQYVKDLQTTQSLFEDMLKEAASGEFVETGDASRTAFSPIEYDADGKAFVHIDEDILKNVPENEWIKTVKNVLREKFADGIDYKGKTIAVSGKSRSEFTNSDYTHKLPNREKADKYRMANNLDEIINAQDNVRNENPNHARTDDIISFDRGDITVEIGNRAFDAEILIANKQDGTQQFYDIINLVQTTIQHQSQTGRTTNANTVDGDNSAVSTFSISENEPVVNTKNTDVVPRVSSQDANNSGRNQQPVSNNSIPENNETVKHLPDENNVKTNLSAASEGIEKVNPEYSISDKAAPIDKQPARNTETPKTVTKAQYVSRFARTAVEAGEAPTAAVSEFEKEILDGTMLHEEIRDKEAKANVEKLINSKGFQAAMDAWDVLINGGKTLSDDDMALGQELYNRSILNKDVTNAVKVAAELSTQTAKSGQNPHMVSILNKLPPDGRLYYLERSVKEINRNYKNKLGDKHKDIRLNEDLMKRFLKADTEEARNDVYDEICMDIADQIPTTNMDKWNAWRYLSMLGNPKTHIRNIIGNAVFYPVVRVKGYVNAGLEKAFVKQENRTTSFTKTKGSKAYAAKDFELVKNELQGINAKYAVTSDIESKRRIFKVGALEFLRKKNGDLLEAEDLIFLKAHYEDAFARVMTARGITAEQLDGDTNGSKMRLNKIREIAMREAQEATYRDANSVASALNRAQRWGEKNKNRVVRVLVGGGMEAIMPFKKTPLNVAKRGIEYSPIGLLNGVMNATTGVKKGKITASEAINKISKGFVGTGIMILGYWLANMGLLTGEGDENEKKSDFEGMIGKQNYALNIGGKYYTIDWMAPVSMPLFIGVELQKTMQNGKWTFAKVIDALSTVSEPLLELSCMSSLQGFIDSIKYSNGNISRSIPAELATSYFTQALPTFGGQLARMIDNKKRNAYYRYKDSQFPVEVQAFIGQVAAKVPGASKLLEPKIDRWGQEEDYGELAERLIENSISPGYYSEEHYTKVEKELERLHKAVGGNDMFPIDVEKSITIDGKTYNLNVHQYTQFARLRGQKSFELVSDLMDDNIRRKKQGAKVATTVFYDSLDDDEKVEQISKCYDDALEYAKEEIQPMLK